MLRGEIRRRYLLIAVHLASLSKIHWALDKVYEIIVFSDSFTIIYNHTITVLRSILAFMGAPADLGALGSSW